jgi:hypothetical protein
MAEEKSPLGRPRHRWVDNNKIDPREIGCGGMDWIDLTQDRNQVRALVNMVMNFRVPQNVGNFLSSCMIGCFSRRAELHEVSYYKELTWGNQHHGRYPQVQQQLRDHALRMDNTRLPKANYYKPKETGDDGRP